MAEVANNNKPFVLSSAPYDEDPASGLTPLYVDCLQKHFRIIWMKDLKKDSKLGALIKGVAVVRAPVMNMTMEYLNKGLMPNLKVVSNHGVGVDHIPVEDLRSRDIYVTNTPDVLSDATADMGMALLLASARNIGPGLKMAMGKDPVPIFPLHFLGREVSGATLGIIGLGRIGRKVAQRAKGFNMDILYHSRNKVSEDDDKTKYFADLYEMLPLCDYVIVTCPLSPATKGLIGEKAFHHMKSTATIINIARGPIVDQDALVNALSNDQIRAAALDVTYPEPLPRDHPLLRLNNFIITPHFGSQTVETRTKMFDVLVENLKAVIIDGKKPPQEVL